MRTTRTKAFSLPVEIANRVEHVATDAGITDSALVTAMLSAMFKFAETMTPKAKKEFLNSLYGKKE